MDAYKTPAVQGSILVLKSLANISVHKTAKISAYHYGVKQVTWGSHKNDVIDFFDEFEARCRRNQREWLRSREDSKKSDKIRSFSSKIRQNPAKSSEKLKKTRKNKKKQTKTRKGICNSGYVAVMIRASVEPAQKTANGVGISPNLHEKGVNMRLLTARSHQTAAF